jgi:hypothetical protein
VQRGARGKCRGEPGDRTGDRGHLTASEGGIHPNQARFITGRHITGQKLPNCAADVKTEGRSVDTVVGPGLPPS